MTQKGRIVKDKPRLLWVGDLVSHTGFASVGHAVLDRLMDRYDITGLGINYYGDPHSYKYPIYPAPVGGDVFGIKRLPNLIRQVQPHIVCIINDTWLVRDYMDALTTSVGKINGIDAYPHKVAYMPIDGKNIQPDFIKRLNELDYAIFYNQFGVNEARKSGLTIDNVSIISHGVDLIQFTSMTTKAARTKLASIQQDWFVVGCVARN